MAAKRWLDRAAARAAKGLLGSLLTDIPQAETYQLHREPPGWAWPNHEEEWKLRVEEPPVHDPNG